MRFIISAVFIIGLGLLLRAYDAHEALYRFTRLHEGWELDEIILLLPGAVLVLAAAAWHKGLTVKREIRQRVLAEDRASTALADALHQEQLRKEFMIHVSHELNVPVNGIMGMLQLLDSEDDPEQIRQDARLALASARTLKHIISSVAVFVDLEKDGVEKGYETFPARDLLSLSVDRFKPLAVEKGLVLEVEADPSVPETIHAHRPLLQLIMDNLVSNAVKYTDKGSVHARLFHDADRGRLVMDVADTGRGISPEDQERIFMRYFRSKDTGEVQGLGLGLSLMRHSLSLLDGDVEVTSEPGKGSRFKVSLPMVG